MEIDQIKDLMSALEEAKLRKIKIKKGDFELHIEKNDETVFCDVPEVQEIQRPAIPQKQENLKEPEKKEGTFVDSPMVGTFYLTPSPDQPPFVKVGDTVDENTVICIVEAMKVMNEVKSGVKGIVAEILIENAQPVEFGAKMFRII